MGRGEVGKPADSAGEVEDVVEKDPLKGLAAFFMADIGDGEDGEGFRRVFQRRGPDPQVEGLDLPLPVAGNAALPLGRGTLEAGQGGAEDTAGLAGLGAAAAPRGSGNECSAEPHRDAGRSGRRRR